MHTQLGKSKEAKEKEARIEAERRRKEEEMARAEEEMRREQEEVARQKREVEMREAELERKKQEFAKNKAAGKAMAVVGGTKRPDKVRPYRVHHECQQDHAHI